MLGEPTPEQAAKAVARSAGVTVRDLGGWRFLAWSDPESKYSVVFDPDRPGGWCKHVAACAAEFLPWLPQVAHGVAALEGRIESAEKELKVERKRKAR